MSDKCWTVDDKTWKVVTYRYWVQTFLSASPKLYFHYISEEKWSTAIIWQLYSSFKTRVQASAKALQFHPQISLTDTLTFQSLDTYTCWVHWWLTLHTELICSSCSSRREILGSVHQFPDQNFAWFRKSVISTTQVTLQIHEWDFSKIPVTT